MTPQALADLIRDRAKGHSGRFMVGIAGPPASGKSTLTADLARALGPSAIVVAMDGYHYDDAVLDARGHRSRKGAPHTFDTGGLTHTLGRIRAGEEVAIPVFDRALELSRAGAAVVGHAQRIILVEGNYLLLNRAPWTDLRALFDLTILITAPESLLVHRLTARWKAYGRTDGQDWIQSNDLPNIRIVLAESSGADLVIMAADKP